MSKMKILNCRIILKKDKWIPKQEQLSSPRLKEKLKIDMKQL